MEGKALTGGTLWRRVQREPLLQEAFVFSVPNGASAAVGECWHNTTQHHQAEGSDGGACQDSDWRQIIRCQVNESTGSWWHLVTVCGQLMTLFLCFLLPTWVENIIHYSPQACVAFDGVALTLAKESVSFIGANSKAKQHAMWSTQKGILAHSRLLRRVTFSECIASWSMSNRRWSSRSGAGQCSHENTPEQRNQTLWPEVCS